MSKVPKAEIGQVPDLPISMTPTMTVLTPSSLPIPSCTPIPSSTVGREREVAELCSDQRGHSNIRIGEGECPKCAGQINQLLQPMGERDGIARCLTCEAIILIDGVDPAPDRSLVLDQLLIELSLRAMNPKSFNN